MDIKIMLWYDVEDYITPESDDALDKLIDMMDKRGIVSSLKVVADKARVLRDRGRFDIINKFSGHEICYHTDNHSRHPTMTEYLESYGFADGAEEFMRREEKGLRDVTDITGQFSSSYGQPGASWASQTFPVLRKWGIPTYLDSHDIIDLNGKPFWYGGILNLTCLSATMRMNLNGGENDLDTAKKEFDILCAETETERTLLISIFYHPCEFSCTEFWDGVNFAYGKNRPKSEWKPSELRKPGEMEILIDRLGRFIDYTLSKENAEYITASQSLDYEIKSKSKITCKQIKEFAAGVKNKINFAEIAGNWHAPSELLPLMAKYINKKHLIPNLSYGPEKCCKSCVDGPVKIKDIAMAFEQQYNKVFGYKQLPDLYKLNNGVINPADMFCTLAAAISKGLSENENIDLINGELTTEKYVKNNTDWSGRHSWIIFPDEFKVLNTVRMAKLQTWTLKPAHY
ncbi:MAG: hypothetical protein FWF92_09375 [Oscillospiraceae bacterium]|nr:hypothetical protein [Oscillospiraceae bacterium]